MGPVTVAIVGGVLSILVVAWTVFTSVQAARAQTTAEELQKKQTEATIRAQSQLIEAAEENRKLSARLLSSAEENKRLSAESQALITGGDGYAYLEVSVMGDMIVLTPENLTKYAQYDVHVGVTDQNASEAYMRSHPSGVGVSLTELLAITRRELTIGTMPSQTASGLLAPPFSYSMDGMIARGFFGRHNGKKWWSFADYTS